MKEYVLEINWKTTSTWDYLFEDKIKINYIITK
jgi:hypothetical protein